MGVRLRMCQHSPCITINLRMCKSARESIFLCQPYVSTYIGVNLHGYATACVSTCIAVNLLMYQYAHESICLCVNVHRFQPASVSTWVGVNVLTCCLIGD